MNFWVVPFKLFPHVTNEIKNRILAAAENGEIDVVLVEIGGTVGGILKACPFWKPSANCAWTSVKIPAFIFM